MTDPTRVLLADARGIVRAGVCALLAPEPDLLLVGEALDAGGVDRGCARHQPHVLILGPDLPGLPSVDLVARLRHDWPGVGILALVEAAGPFVIGLLAAGVTGCLVAREPPTDLARAVRAVAGGGSWVCPPFASRLAGAGEPSPEPLTEEELRLLRLLARGASQPAMAAAMGLSERTVRNRLAGLCARLGLGTRAELIAWTARHGLDREDEGGD